jgi:hypothetical protein
MDEIEAVLWAWAGPLPRLAYITHGGNHQTQVLPQAAREDERSSTPWRTAEVGVGDRLLTCERIRLQTGRGVVLRLPEEGELGAEDVTLAQDEVAGIYRVLDSAETLQRRRIEVGAKREQFGAAYNYLRKRIRFREYVLYRRSHMPIGSGVPKAARKTVCTQRMKQSTMTWKAEWGQWIVDLRVIHWNGTWREV